MRTRILAAMLATVGLAPACRHSEPAASSEATGRPARPSVRECADLWNARGNRANQKLIATRYTKAAVYSWKIKTGDYGCGVSVVASRGRWLQWGNTILPLERDLDWSRPVGGAKWGIDTPHPLPRLNASIRSSGKVMLR
jgi:hypothetical protein